MDYSNTKRTKHDNDVDVVDNNKIPILSSSPSTIITQYRKQYQTQVAEGEHRILALFSSILGGIITEETPEFLTVPIDDHIVHRAHAVFDTCNIMDGYAIGLEYHLDRLLKSAMDSKITPYAQKQDLKQIVLQTLAASKARNGIYCRMWMSVGRGDFNVSPLGFVDKTSTFYVVVHTYDVEAKQKLKQEGSKECVVNIPIKPQFLATKKTTNYLVNALACMEAKESGMGSLGLQLDERGFIAETSIGSLGFVFNNGIIKTPHLTHVLKSTTLIRTKELLEENPQAVPSLGSSSGKIEFADISLDELNQHPPVEILAFGGGHIIPVVLFNGKQVGKDGKPGPVCRELDALLQSDEKFKDQIPYT
jgi:4-amino-4-deoxychorismate lyase